MKAEQKREIKIAYLHGRPAPHPMHRKFSESVGAEFEFVDFKMRWQDLDKSMLYRIVSWFVCAFSYPQKSKYDLFLVDNLHFSPVIMKSLGLIKRKQKIIAHMGSHTLYFIYAHRFSKLTEWMHIQALKRYDALICEGQMAEELARKILGNRGPKLYTVFNGIPKEHSPSDKGRTKNLSGKNILFMGHGPGENRLWYKGLDLMLSSFSIAYKNDDELTFTIVGNWDKSLTDKLLLEFDEKTRAAINFVGETNDLSPYTNNASLYLHCARGEAYGITILIAMAAGIPSIVSEWTGAKELVANVDDRFILPLEPNKIADQINWYFKCSLEEKIAFSRKSIDVIKTYTEESAISFYKETFVKIQHDLLGKNNG